ncbi:polymorphic toxin-type HINT domain-containing protein [Yinghuangia soli]|uniref:Hint domain-containing protein n=1 Tax=Yinghuangia soli TaxID=2908204 RepID=A0AA41Q475_9ACTN|nr:polymorphic toxin-type HINT domain-containing protein [Yinghuangia soli]MCF2530902.1 hypothetical protein [Yinghuangia soli]
MTPVWVRPVAGAAQAKGASGTSDPAAPAASGRVTVTVADRGRSEQAGVRGLMVAVAPKDASAAGKLTVAVDYAGIQASFGGDWASRVRLVALPGCALTTPQLAECRTQTPVASRNDFAAKQVFADVDLAAVDTADATARAAGGGSGVTVLAATAAPSGQNGDYTATSLSPTGSWSAGGSTGTFSWSYPLNVPPAIGGTAPSVVLAYNSAAVDGRTSARNAQTSWIGDGWDYSPGFIERSFQSCKLDGKDNTGESCWSAKQPLTMSLNGKNTEFVPVDGSPGTWRTSDGTGTKIERLTGAANGDQGGADDTGEHWRVTTSDGTRYLFGLQAAPGAGASPSNATWTRPIFANNAGEPCYNADFAAAWCQQAYRWNLVAAVDVRGNLVAYTYDVETNVYARNPDQAHPNGTLTPYTRAGQLVRIDYGFKENGAEGPTARVLFGSEERCAPGKTCAPGGITSANQANWPDVPYDQNCSATAPVADCKNYAPTFWSTRRLKTVTTEVVAAGAPKRLDQWTLTHDFPDPTDGTTPTLWLSSIARTAYAGDGNLANKVDFASTDFNGMLKPNRVDTRSGNMSAINRRRLTEVTTETGGRITVAYESDCTAGQFPAPDSNTKRCYPVYWNPSPGTPMDPELDWFHKYVVTGVAEVDTTTPNSRIRTTRYEYVGDAAWHRDDSELTENEFRTWGDFRGYGEVITRAGNTAAHPGDLTTKSSTVYLRGMDGDYKADNTRRSVTIPGSTAKDVNVLAGTVRESRTYLGDSATVVSTSVNDPKVFPPSATHVRGPNLPDQTSQMVRTERTVSRALLSTGQWSTASKATTFDTEFGVPLTALDSADGLPDYCTTTAYAHNRTRNILALPVETHTVTGNCSVAPGTTTTVSHMRTLYDDRPFGEIGENGAARVSQVVDKYGPLHTLDTVSEYDGYGRITKVTDPANNSTSTAFEPATGALPTKVTVTGPMDSTWRTVTENAVGRNLPVKITDLNGRVTEMQYDAAGRLTAVWTPGRKKSTQSANVTFAYAPSKTAPSVVSTRKLREDGSYSVSHEIYDALLQLRQTQTSTADNSPGRILSDTFYDSLGRVIKANKAYWDKTTAPNGVLWQADDNMVPGQAATFYDGLSRTVRSTFSSYAIDQNKVPTGGPRVLQTTTLTYYPGADRTTVVPPDGSTATTVISNARGKTAELRQYRDRGQAGSDDPATYDLTRYTYDSRDKLATVTGPTNPSAPLGATWSWTYDLLGRLTHSDDPDRGPADTTYDAVGRVESNTDARGQKLVYTYDKINRKTATYAGSIGDANLLASWTYDPVGAKGQALGSTQYVGGKNGAAYSTSVTGYDVAYRPRGTTTTIPAAEGKLAGAYTTSQTYTPNIGLPYSTTLPAAGGLPGETVYTRYSDTGLATGLVNGSVDYVHTTTYDPFGRVKRMTLGSVPKQLAFTPTYEEATGRLLTTTLDRQTDQNGNPVFAAVDTTDYTYKPNGAVTSISTRRDDGSVDRQCFTYDYLQRMTEAWTDTGAVYTQPAPSVPGVGGCANQAPAQTNIGGPAPYWQTYEFDVTGNRTKLIEHNVADPTKNTTTQYTYPAANAQRAHALSSTSTVGWTAGGAQVTTGGTYGYDSAGNTIQRPVEGGSQTLTWDAEGKLSSNKTTYPGIYKTSTYLYDAGGSRLIRRDVDKVTLYLGSDELTLNVAADTVTGTRYYATANGAPGIVRTTNLTGVNKLSYQAGDHHNTASTSLDAATLAVTRRAQKPYGEDRGPSPTAWPDDKGFLGKPKDSTGLTHIGAREYDPGLGRFISVDPVMDLSDPQQMHGYAYANSRPVTSSDPSGLYMQDDSGAGSAPAAAPPQASDAADRDPPTVDDWYQPVTVGKYVKIPYNFKNRDKFIHEMNRRFEQNRAQGFEPRMADAYWIAVQTCWIKDMCTDEEAQAIGLVKWYVWEEAGLNGNIGKTSRITKGLPPRKPTGAPVAGTPLDDFKKQYANKNSWLKQFDPTADDDCNSFVPGTEVLMADGTKKKIEDVKVGDLVLATDPETGETGPRPVTALILGEGEKTLVDISVAIEDAEGTKFSTITATDGHPFWAANRNAWVDAVDLLPGDFVQTSAGTYVQITALDVRTESWRRVHNLTIADLHTYFVIVGGLPVLVHNTACERFTDEYLYRGVAQGHWEYENASKGRAVPLGTGTDIRGHVGDQTDTIFTSWTHSLDETATYFATHHRDDPTGKMGVIMRIKIANIDPTVGPSRNIQIHDTIYDQNEFEHLLVGEIYAEEVSFDLGETWHTPWVRGGPPPPP